MSTCYSKILILGIVLTILLSGGRLNAAAVFPQSDIVVWQLPGQGTGAYFFDEGGAEAFQYNILGNNVIQPGLTDTIFIFSEPVPNGDPGPGNPMVSDILAAKVTGNTYNLSFCSDGSAITQAQFLAPLGLVNPIQIQLPATGGLQDLSAFFPSLKRLFIASDLNNQPIQDPDNLVPNGLDGGGGAPFPSDFVSENRAPNTARFERSFDDIGGPEKASLFNDPVPQNDQLKQMQ